MHWEWVVPVIALALWIISSLVKGAEEPAKQAKPGEPLPDNPPRPQSDVDKFLEEINRMRRRQEEEQQQQERQQERRQETQPRRSERIPPPVAPPPVVVQVEPTSAPNFENPSTIPEKPRPRPVKPRRAESRPTQLKQPAPVVPPLPPPVPRVTDSKPLSPAAVQLYSMLRSPQSVQAAILLHEVLGPPRCRRRR